MTPVLAFALLVAPPVRFGILVQGTKAGSGTIEQRLLEDGRKLSRVEMRFDDLGIEVSQESTYNPDGSPSRMLQATTRGGSRSVRTAVFEDRQVVFSGTGLDTTKVAYPTGGSVRAASEFWFLRDRPILNEKLQYHRFDLGTGSWKLVSAVFVGERETVLAGKVWKVHRTLVDDVRSDLDERGDPVRVELSNGIVLERR